MGVRIVRAGADRMQQLSMRSDSMASDTTATREIFRQYLDEHGDSGPIGDIAARLAEGTLTREHVGAVLGVRPAAWILPTLLDLPLHYVRTVLQDHVLSAAEQDTVRDLKLLLRIREGDFLEHRRAEVAVLLAQQLDRMLEDEHIDDAEALQQVELQRAFDLGYDEYLALTRTAVDDSVERLLHRIDSPSTPDASVKTAYAQLEALRTVYLLNTAQKRRIGHRY